MFDVFRFMLARPPTPTDPATTVSLDATTMFANSLREALQTASAQAAMQLVARAMRETG